MPQYVVDELLAAEGITEVDYVVTDSGPLMSQAIASGQIDFAMSLSVPSFCCSTAAERSRSSPASTLDVSSWPE